MIKFQTSLQFKKRACHNLIQHFLNHLQEYKLMATTPLRDQWLPSLTLLHNKQTRERDATYAGYAFEKKTANQRSTATTYMSTKHL